MKTIKISPIDNYHLFQEEQNISKISNVISKEILKIKNWLRNRQKHRLINTIRGKLNTKLRNEGFLQKLTMDELKEALKLIS